MSRKKRKAKMKNKILLLGIILLLAVVTTSLIFLLNTRQGVESSSNATANATNYTFVNEDINITLPPNVSGIRGGRIKTVK